MSPRTLVSPWLAFKICRRRDLVPTGQGWFNLSSMSTWRFDFRTQMFPTNSSNFTPHTRLSGHPRSDLIHDHPLAWASLLYS